MKRIFLIAFSLASFSGCMIPMSVGKKINQDDISKIERCKTTKEEILSIFGKPVQEGIQSGHKTMQWGSAGFSMFGTPHQQSFQVFLNDTDKVVDYTLNPVGLVEIKDTCKD